MKILAIPLRAVSATLAFALWPAIGLSTQVYKCETASGVVYSAQPCADDAQVVNVRSRSTGGAAARPTAVNQPPIDTEKFDNLADLDAEAVLSEIGLPAGLYYNNDLEYWFYPNACRDEGRRECVLLLVKDDRPVQINWLGEQEMQQSAEIARSFGGWRPPEQVRDKTYSITGLGDLRGLSKTTLVARVGQPDVKRVFNGVEIWEYRQVRMQPGASERLTMYVEFDGSEVVNSSAN